MDHRSISGSQYPPTAVRSFRDALGIAMGLADDYAFVNAAVLLDEQHITVDVLLTEGIGRSIGPLVGLACGAVERLPNGKASAPGRRSVTKPELSTVSSVLLLTVRPFEVDIIRESDLELYRRACWTMSAAGACLADWIETDGDLFRSYAYVTCPGLAWPDDPPEERIGHQALS